jgi:hypothetical protein
MTDHSHTAPPSDPELRIKALESLLVEKQLIDPAAVDEIIETYEHRIGPRNGAKVADFLYGPRTPDDANSRCTAGAASEDRVFTPASFFLLYQKGRASRIFPA